MRRSVEHALVCRPVRSGRIATLRGGLWAIEVLLGSGSGAPPTAREPRERVSAGVAAGPGACSQVRDICPARRVSPGGYRCDLEPAGLILDGLDTRCVDRPSLPVLSHVLDDAARQRRHRRRCPAVRPSRSGGDSRGWSPTGHGRERYAHRRVRAMSSSALWPRRRRCGRLDGRRLRQRDDGIPLSSVPWKNPCPSTGLPRTTFARTAVTPAR